VSASVSDATSGPAQTEDSAAADTTTVGAKTATVTGTDLAGNQATSGCGYRVSYRFDEFAHPVDNPHANGKPVLNVVKGSQAVALKRRLTDATGALLSTLTGAQITVVGMTRTAAATSDQVEEAAAGASGLQNLGNANSQLN
jgi:hypothetical protein